MTDLERLAEGTRSLGMELSAAQLDQYRSYIAGLVAWNQRLNLASREALADAERTLLLDSLSLVPLIVREQGPAGSLVDVGSGAGFPGLALKVALQGLRVVLVEATRKKAEFLAWMAAELGLPDVEVVAERAEEVARRPEYREAFDVATARALGPLPVVMELTLPLCRVGGLLIAPRSSSAEAEAESAKAVATQLGGRLRGVEAVEVGRASGTALVVIDKVEETPPRFPRRTGVPAKRPLG